MSNNPAFQPANRADAGRSPLAIVLDFDGTITEQDIGDKVIMKFAAPGWEEGVERLKNGEWTVGQLQRWEAMRLPGTGLREMVAYALKIARVRPGLKELLLYARENGIYVETASAGFEFYVKAILEREGLGDLVSAVPRVVFPDLTDEFGQVHLEYPAGMETCEETGLCKCERVWRLQKKGLKVVFVGDGVSDYCPAEHADVLFARAPLARMCDRAGIAYKPFNDFKDVLSEVRRLNSGATDP